MSPLEEAVAGLTMVWWMATSGTCPKITREDYPELYETVSWALLEARYRT